MDGPGPATPSQPVDLTSNASHNGTSSANGNASPSHGSAARPGGAAGVEPGSPSSATDDITVQFQKLSAAMEAKMRQLSVQEEQLKQQEAAMSAAARRMSSLSSRLRSDVIALNVGGTPLAASRRTLTLLPDSLLGTMFSGAWDDHLQRDDSGRVFLDYDPSLFSLLLNWLRAEDMGGPDAPLAELAVEPAREEQLLVLIDFLQLQRHVPCRFTETFSPSLSSPFLTLAGSSAWRTASPGAAQPQPPRQPQQGDYAVASSCHAFFDVDVELLLEVLRFGAVTRVPSRGDAAPSEDPEEPALPNNPMFVGVMAKGQLAALDLTRRRSNASWQSTCHGWWTRSRRGCEVRQGNSKIIQHSPLWCEGDTLRLTLEAAKHPARLASRPGGGPRITLTNPRSQQRLQLDIAAECLGEFAEQWVLVVGLAGRGDEVRINSAKRKGTKVHATGADDEAVEAGGKPGTSGGKGGGVDAAAGNGAAEPGGAGGQGGAEGAEQQAERPPGDIARGRRQAGRGRR